MLFCVCFKNRAGEAENVALPLFCAIDDCINSLKGLHLVCSNIFMVYASGLYSHLMNVCDPFFCKMPHPPPPTPELNVSLLNYWYSEKVHRKKVNFICLSQAFLSE